MRVQLGAATVVLTDPFDSTPSSVSATATRASTGAVISTAPTTSVIGDRVRVTLNATHHTDVIDDLTVKVSATVDGLATHQTFTVEVVGSHYVTIGALREEPQLGDSSRYPDSLLADIRDEVEGYVEEVANVAFVPRYGSESHTGDGTNTLVLRTNRVRAITALTVDGVTQTLTDLDLLDGDVLRRTSGLSFSWADPVVVKFTHGHDRPPAKLVREIRKAIRSEVLARGAQAPSDRLWEQTADGLTVRFSTADFAAGRYTGQLNLDAAIHAYGYPRMGFA